MVKKGEESEVPQAQELGTNLVKTRSLSRVDWIGVCMCLVGAAVVRTARWDASVAVSGD